MIEGSIQLRVDITQLRTAMKAILNNQHSQVSPMPGVRFYPNINVIQIDETAIIRSTLIYLRELPDGASLVMRKSQNGVIWFETREETFREIVEAARKAGT